MRFLLPDPLGNDKHSMMFHSSGFAIAAGVVAVGAAAASAAISMSAADRAKRAQGAAAGQFKKALRGVEAPTYDVGAMIADAARISAAQRAELEKFQPGAAALRKRSVGQLNKAMGVTDQYLRGEIPQDVREQTMRNIAEFGGAGFNPATAGQAGGFQAAQALVPRQFGLTSLDLQRQGLAAVPAIQGTAQNWQQLARAFTADPLAVGELQYRFQMGAAEVGLAKATGVYSANKENIAASYAAQQAVGQGVQQIGQATSGALMGMSGAAGGAGGAGGYGQYAQMLGGMGGAGTGPGATPLYNQPYTFQTKGDQYGQVAGGRIYQGGNVASGDMAGSNERVPRPQSIVYGGR
jgi:hypothetical protein